MVVRSCRCPPAAPARVWPTAVGRLARTPRYHESWRGGPRSGYGSAERLLLKHHLKALRLPTMTAECEKVARRCAAEDVDHLGFLLQLCELELIERERRAAQRRLKAARFPTIKTLESFDFAAAPALNKPLVLELARCDFVERRENLLLVGGPGTGKPRPT